MLTPPRSPPWEGVGSVVLRVCGRSRPSILWLLGASRQGWYLPAVSDWQEEDDDGFGLGHPDADDFVHYQLM